MGYTKVGPFVNGGAPALSAANLDQMETQYDEAKTDLDDHNVISRHRKIAVGTYTGSGVHNRQITTGFLCKFVLIQSPNSINRWTMTPNNSFYDSSSAHAIDVTDVGGNKCRIHATDGFEVSNQVSQANLNARAYDYIAFG